MQLKKLRIQNFRCYKESEFVLHPNFNLIVGENGSGKTSFLEATAVAIGSWFLGVRGHDSRNIREHDVRVLRDMVEKRYRELPQYPVQVYAEGNIHIAKASRDIETNEITYQSEPFDKPVEWSRSILGIGGRTTQASAKELTTIARLLVQAVYKQEPRILPLIRYFGAGRLWESVRDSDSKALSKHKGKQPSEITENADYGDRMLAEFEKLSEPFYGYRMSVDKRCNPDDLIRWMAFERRNEIDEDENSPALRLVYKAIESMLPEAKSVRYSVKLKTLILQHVDNTRSTFNELSDGYRNIAAIAADLAIKAAMLNPQLAEKALDWTPGVVLIDELDLHLHPKWQRRIIEDLRRTFPKLQFICTTHSPYLIQSLRSGDELIRLDGSVTNSVANLGIEAISAALMGVQSTEASPRYFAMLEAAKSYIAELEEAEQSPSERLEEYRRQLSDRIAPFAENPAFQAILEAEKKSRIG